MLRCVSKIALATLVSLLALTPPRVGADFQGVINPQVDTTVTDEPVTALAFLRNGTSFVVAGSTRLWLFQIFPTFEMSSIAMDSLDSLDLLPTSIFVDKNGLLYVVGTSLSPEQYGCLVVLDSTNMSIIYNVIIQRLFAYPSVSVSGSGRIVVSDLVSGSLSVFNNIDRTKTYEVKTVQRAEEVLNLFCGPSLRVSWLNDIKDEEAIISSPFGGGNLEIAARGVTLYKCEPTFNVRPYVSSVVTTVSHTVARSGELVFAGSVAMDRLFVLGDGKEIVGGAETGLHLKEFETGRPSVGGDVHVVADDAGEVIVVASPRVPRISVFRYAEGKIERVGTGSIDHPVDAAAISPDGAVVAVAGSKGGQGVITLLRNPLALQDGEVDYRRTFTNRWAQRALEAQKYDPRGVDGIVGPRTAAAIEGFQEANGLLVDGRLNAETLKLLYDLTETKSE